MQKLIISSGRLLLDFVVALLFIIAFGCLCVGFANINSNYTYILIALIIIITTITSSLITYLLLDIRDFLYKLNVIVEEKQRNEFGDQEEFEANEQESLDSTEAINFLGKGIYRN